MLNHHNSPTWWANLRGLVSFGVTGWAPYWLMASCWRTAKQAGRAVDKNSRQAPSDAEHDIQETDCKGHWSVFLQILPYVLYRHILSILPVVLILASFTHPWPRHQYQPPLPEAARFFEDAKKKNSTLGISKQPRLQTQKKRMRSKKDVGLPEINGLLYAFHAILETFHCKECDGPSNQCICFWISDQIRTRFSRGPNISETF